jgi:hypothetical protein
LAESPPDIEALSLDDLKRLVLRLLEERAALKSEIAGLREDNARLKGLKGRPKIKPSGMDKTAAERRQSKERRKQARRGQKTARLVIDQERRLALQAPPGSRFKGSEACLVQDLVIRPHTVRYHRERWVTPSGKTLVAPLPAGIEGHFGPELRRLVLALYHRGQTTVARLVALLGDLGVLISKRQVMRLLLVSPPTLRHDQTCFHSCRSSNCPVVIADQGFSHVDSDRRVHSRVSGHRSLPGD